MVYSIHITKIYGRHPACKFLDGDIKDINLAGPETKESSVIRLINRRSLQLTGVPIVLPNPPTTLRWGSVKSIHDFYIPHAFPFVCKEMKDIIEGFEPGVHQFWPLQLVDKRKQPIAKRWLWNVCNLIDSMDRQHTTYFQRHGQHWAHPERLSDDELPEGYDRSVKPKYVVSNERVGGAHFWRDPNIVANPIFCSHAAGKTLGAENFDRLGLLAWESV